MRDVDAKDSRLPLPSSAYPMTTHGVPFLDLGGINARFRAEFVAAIGGVLESNRYLLGSANAQFADDFSKWIGTRHCVPLANGLDALRLTLKAWLSLGRLKAGDEVIVPANSFIASALAVSDSGLELRFADVDASTFCISAQTVEPCLTERTRVVMPVHLYGRLSDTAPLRALCERHDLLLLEDAAQSHGARVGGTAAGALGDAAGFSFYPSKNLGALGDAGCVTTNDEVLADRVRMLGNYGSLRKYEHDHLGVNSRMDEIQAAVLRVKLGSIDADNERRRQIARFYTEYIAHPDVTTPTHPEEASSHVWHLYVLRARKRTALAQHLNDDGIETMIHYPTAIHLQPPYRASFGSMPLPVSTQLQDEVLSLPMSPIMSDAQVERVVAVVNAWPGGR